MKIKYLKETHDSKVGDVKEIQDHQANVLIKLNFAEIYQEQKKPSPKAKPSKTEE